MNLFDHQGYSNKLSQNDEIEDDADDMDFWESEVDSINVLGNSGNFDVGYFFCNYKEQFLLHFS